MPGRSPLPKRRFLTPKRPRGGTGAGFLFRTEKFCLKAPRILGKPKKKSDGERWRGGGPELAPRRWPPRPPRCDLWGRGGGFGAMGTGEKTQRRRQRADGHGHGPFSGGSPQNWGRQSCGNCLFLPFFWGCRVAGAPGWGHGSVQLENKRDWR